MQQSRVLVSVTIALIVLVLVGLSVMRRDTTVTYQGSILVRVHDGRPGDTQSSDLKGESFQPLPDLDARLNSPAFIEKMSKAMAHHPPAAEWTPDSTSLGAQRYADGSIAVYCVMPVYFVWSRSFWWQETHFDEEKTAELERDLAAFFASEIPLPETHTDEGDANTHRAEEANP